ncbi:MAG: hypothetical protein K9H26_09115 [Prolixibacteraceae bacterium]|nr:hypothetical protein [Prolixibacteraceae bacterium]
MEGSYVNNKAEHKKRIFNLCYALLALLTGTVIYCFFRPEKPSLLNIFNAPGWIKNQSINNPLSEWLIYSLPDGLWAFAYTVIIITIWKGHLTIIRYFWYATIPVLIFGFELLQLSGKLPGTFCLQDMVFSAAGIIAGIIISKSKIKKP